MEAEKDKDIVLVHAGMTTERALQLFRHKMPERYFDVGMAEQHAVTFASGLACGGMKPFCIIPSSFLQRAYDQVISHLYIHIYHHLRSHLFFTVNLDCEGSVVVVEIWTEFNVKQKEMEYCYCF